MPRNVLRDELVDAMRARLAHAWRHDPKALLVVLIKLVNAVMLTAWWLDGFSVGWPFLLGLIVFTALMVVAFKLEKSRPPNSRTP
jgi:fatty acid desaturase